MWQSSPALPSRSGWICRKRNETGQRRNEMAEASPATTDVFEVIHTMRAMRRLKPDPVPDELIRKILLAGQASPSGGNTQRWRFLVIKDTEIKK